MNMSRTLHLQALIFGFCLAIKAFQAFAEHETDERKAYIVYMGEAQPNSRFNALEEHHNLLLTAVGDERTAREAKIHSYGKSINGFVARLLPHEAQTLSREEGVVSVFENTRRKLHTTRSWSFLGLYEKSYRRRILSESNVIVGLLDTGIYMDSPSFNDRGFGPPPAKWKGKCVTGPNLTHCNNKVIGAKYFNLETKHHGDDDDHDSNTAADYQGHGTHTASTVAGVPVRGASLFGIAKGTARGGVPSARIAAYKVCWAMGCSDMDLLAGFDEAISDRVDVISLSVGGPTAPFFKDPVAIGAFHAMKKGILTSCSAGNDGPDLFTVQNVAPWILTVAANSIDRLFQTPVKLGNGHTTNGISINTFSPKKKIYPLTSGLLASNVSDDDYSNPSVCDFGSLEEDKVKGRVVYCEGGNAGQDNTIKGLKGAGVIVRLDASESWTDLAYITLISGSYVLSKDGNSIGHYINSTKNPQAVIYKTRTVKMTAPSVASFSSRGPQHVSLNILKPDVSAPGLNILAAYSKLVSVTSSSEDKRYTFFNVMSGTSMACPHASAAAAYVKSFHPNWSPAAIKSALMTTATPMRVKEEDAELGCGSGQINPRRAIYPGLVYDVSLTSYIRYLCKEGYNSTTIALLFGGKKRFNCKDFKHALGTDGLNYPSMHKQLKSTETKVSAVFHRIVTNVGMGMSVYRAKVTAPKGLRVEVVPNVMMFTRPYMRRSFKVKVNGVWPEENKTGVLSAALEWNDRSRKGHSVRSPIVIFKAYGSY